MRNKVINTIALLLVTMIAFCGCAKNSDGAIKINDTVITRGEFNKEFDMASKERFAQDPTKLANKKGYAMLSFKEEFINNLIKNELLKQEFDKRKIEATQEDIAEERQRVIDRFGSEEQLRTMMEQEGLTEEQFIKDMTNEVKMQKLINQIGRVTVSDDDALKFYNKNKAMFNVPERVKVSQIMIEVNPEAMKREIVEADKEILYSASEIDKKIEEKIKQKEAFANEIQKKANPKNFAALAKQYSEDMATKDKGGDLGYVTKEMLNKEFGDAAFSQKVGVVGPVGQTEFGYHIILVTDKQAEGIQPFAVVKEDIKRNLSDEETGKKIDDFLNGLKDNANIEFLDKTLDPAYIKKQLEEILKKQIDSVSKDK